MRFSDIVGHREQIESLREMADSDKVPHALLFAGTSGIGKISLAMAFAQYLHCENHIDGDSCGKCPACLQHTSMNNADMYYVYPVHGSKSVSEDFIENWRQFIKENPFTPYEKWLEMIDAGNSQPLIHVEESSEILRKMHLSNFSAKYKIMLIWLPEKMNVEAANKLLKIIEEPFDDTKFIFVSDEPQNILPTIFSRTQRINLKKPLPASVAAYLSSQYGVEESVALNLAEISNGNLNAAIASISTSSEQSEFMALFQDLMRKAYIRDVRQLKDKADDIAAMGREKIGRFMMYFARMIRENYIYNLQMPQLRCLNAEESAFSSRFSPFIHERNVEKIIEEIDKARADIARNANAKIVMFDFCIKLIILIKS